MKALLVIQAVAFFVERLSTERFALGYASFWSSLFAIAIPCIELVIERRAGYRTSLSRLQAELIATLVGVAFFRGLFSVLLPRRPSVFWNGKPVDKEDTVSALSRYSFSWADELLAYALRNRSLEVADLPTLSSITRAENLSANFEVTKATWRTKRLWKLLLICHWRPIAVELFLTLLLCVLSFGPQAALYGILRSLETYGAGSRDSLECWSWVLALGVLMLVASSIEAWLFWIVFSQIYIPLFEELSAVTFSKSMHRKDVKHIRPSNKKSNQSSEESASGKPDTPTENHEEEDEGDARKSRQSIINLVAIDARRVADFASFVYMIPSAIIKVAIACIFLTKLIGWKSLLSGLVVSALVTPANWYVTKMYAHSQDKLMKSRDEKMATVTEVLQGIRQVKFSALENQWQQKVAESRNKELDAQWSSFFYDVWLIFIWILGPLMLSAVSLAVYAVLNGELSASVAFTTIAVFGSLEMSLAILPEMISFSLESKISVNRIDKYLNSPERTPTTVPSNSISFEEATVAWPEEEDETNDQTLEEEEEERFTLQNLNVAFPSKGLSVISGRTGSGKSLLLSSILGESDVLRGTVKVPTSPPVQERHDHLATPQNWIIESAIAYVAQLPWIENATIRDNILFGLPLDVTRYQKVLFACALQKDLEMFTDGELTDIGANGVNLSGGQKWRISFARALYSRAGILIMDDIFSALDAHTGRHLYEYALTGELGRGRTRILVTHHVGLCLPRTDYSVLLADGLVKHAGITDDLRKSNSLADILSEERSAENAAAATEEDEEETALEGSSPTAEGNPSEQANNVNNKSNGTVAKDDRKPRKFNQDEKRETGSIKLGVYTSYLRKGGSIPFWGLVVFAYVSYVSLVVGRVSLPLKYI